MAQESQINREGLARRAPNGDNRRRGSPTIFPPERPLQDRENPSPADLARGDRIHQLELEVENLKEEQQKHKRHDTRLIVATSVVTAGLTTGGVLGGQALLNKVFADEPQPAAPSVDINSFPNSITRDGIRIAGRKAAIAENERDGNWEMTPPPNRQPENLSNIPTTTNVQDIPHIPEVDARLKNANIKWGFWGFLENRQILTGRDQQHLEIKTTPPTATINGYIVAKERQTDGSIVFAIELPYLDSPKDILLKSKESSTPQVKQKEWRSANLPPSAEIQIGGAIVWVRAFEGKNPTYSPFQSSVSWGGPDALPANKSGTGDRPLAEYARVGDLIQARIPLDPNLQIDSANLDKLLGEYIELHGGSIEAAKQRLTSVTQDNLHNAQHLLTDANTNTQVPLETQLDNKSYVFTAETFVFSSQ